MRREASVYRPWPRASADWIWSRKGAEQGRTCFGGMGQDFRCCSTSWPPELAPPMCISGRPPISDPQRLPVCLLLIPRSPPLHIRDSMDRDPTKMRADTAKETYPRVT